MKTISFALAVIMMFTVSCFADNTNIQEIFEKTVASYKAMETYKAQGSLEYELQTKGVTSTESKQDRKSTRLNSSHGTLSRMPSSA